MTCSHPFKHLLATLCVALVATTPTVGNSAPAEPRPARNNRTAKVPSKATVTRGKPAARRAPASQFAFDRDAVGTQVLIVGGEVHTGDGRVLPNASIRVEGARIAEIREGGQATTIPAGATVIDATGKIVTPGFIAADTQIGLVEISGEDATRDDRLEGEQPIRSSFDAAHAIFADSSLIAVNAIEGVTTAAVSPTGGLLSGQVAWIDLVAGEYQSIVAKPRVAVDGTLGQSYGGSRAATIAMLRRVLEDAAFYRTRKAAHDKRQLRDLAAHPLDLEALEPVLAGSIPLTMYADRASDMLALAELAREYRFELVILGGTQAWRVADVLAAANVTVIIQPTQNLPGGFDQLGARLDNAALLHAAGVRVGIASLDESHNVRNVAQEAGIAIAYGLDRNAAMRAVTSTLAEAYGMDADYGSLAPGKVANIVVWDGDPFELSNWPKRVLIRGRDVPLSSRQTLLRERYRDLSRFE